MALLALTLALLAMTVTTMAITEKALDMALDSFDDQYQGCVPAMRAELPALNRSELQTSGLFVDMWPWAMEEWQRRGSPLSPLSSSAQAIAIVAFTTDDLYQKFNEKVIVAGRSPQEYRDNFHYKTLHFLLTDAVAMLRDAQGQNGRCAHWGVDKYKFKANEGDIIRFGQFTLSTLCDRPYNFTATTLFQAVTRYGVDIQAFTTNRRSENVLIPPFEKFKVLKVINHGEKVQIILSSIGTYSKYNCEWLKGGSIPTAPGHLGGLFLATTVLAVATGIL